MIYVPGGICIIVLFPFILILYIVFLNVIVLETSSNNVLINPISCTDDFINFNLSILVDSDELAACTAAACAASDAACIEGLDIGILELTIDILELTTEDINVKGSVTLLVTLQVPFAV
jgi:hypothetical protein